MRAATVMMVLGAVSAAFGQDGQNVTFEWVLVEAPGNPVHTSFGFGQVDYPYLIGEFEVTNAQYAAFLNSVDPDGSASGTYYDPRMGDTVLGGIAFEAANPFAQKYVVKPNMGGKPVVYISYFEAMRFVNWLHNGQGSGDTETGVYEINNGTSEVRAADARFFLPSFDEWYKAAYYQPASAGGSSSNYWAYATRSNVAPTQALATSSGDVANPGSNVANFGNGAEWNNRSGNLTTVGSAGPLSASWFGTSDQGGNAVEWTETTVFVTSKAHMGGAFLSAAEVLESGDLRVNEPTVDNRTTGFRVATWPACIGNVNGDNVVDLTDLAELLAAFGASGPALPADLNADGRVDINDLAMVLRDLTYPCNP